MQVLYFIVPFVFFIVGTGIIMTLSGMVLSGINISIGALHNEDLENLSEKNRAVLKKAFLIITIAGTIVDLLLGAAGSLFFPDNIIILIVAVLLQILFMFLLLRPVLQSAKRLKQMLDNKKTAEEEAASEE